jgi:tetratricopeptide (TPR) repeat protein
VNDLFIGRDDEQDRLRGVLAQVLGTADEPDDGYLVLVHGIGGIGKSKLLRQYRKIVRGKLRDDNNFRGRFLVATVDWEEQRERRTADYPPGGPPLSHALDAIYAAISAATDDATHQRCIERAFNKFRAEAAHAPYAYQNHEVTPAADMLAHAFAEGVREVSREVRPLVLSLDTTEILGDAWDPLCDVIRSSGRQVVWLIGMRLTSANHDSTAGGLKNPIATPDLKRMSSSRLRVISPPPYPEGDIAKYLDARLGTPLPAGITVEAMAALTHGVPLAVQLAVDLLRSGCPAENLLPETYPPGTASDVVTELAARYIGHLSEGVGREHEPDLDLILGLALLLGDQAGPDVLAALWGVEPGSMAEYRDALRRRRDSVFSSGLRLHQEVRDAIRSFLLRPEQRARVRPANQRAVKILHRQLDALGVANLESQLASDEWCSAANSLLWHTLWQDSRAGLMLLSDLLPATLLLRPEFARVLLHTADHFSAVMPEELQRVAAGLHVLVPAASLAGEPHASYEGTARNSVGNRIDMRVVTRAMIASHDGRPSGRPVLANDVRAETLLDLLAVQYPDGFRIGREQRLDLLRRIDDGLVSAQHSPQLSRAVASCAEELAEDLGRSMPSEQHVLEWMLGAADIAVRRDPRSSRAWYLRGLALRRGGRGDDASSAFEQAISLRPDDPDSHHNKGVVLGRLGRDADALAAYEQAIRLRPDDPDIHHNMGVALGRLGRDADSLAAYKQAIRLRPDDPRTHHNKGVALERLGRHADALAAYDRAISLRPGLAATHHNRGVMLGHLGRDTDALAAFEQAISLRPLIAATHYNRGVVLGRLGRDADALAAYQQAISLRPDDPDTHHNMGVVLGRLGRDADALAAYEQAIRLRPDDPDTQSNRGESLLVLGRRDEAMTALRAAIRLARDDTVEAQVLLAALILPTDPAEAQELCRSALPCVDNGLSEFRQGELRALARLMLGEPDAAEAQLRAAAHAHSSADVFERPLYELLRDPPVDGLEGLLTVWSEIGAEIDSTAGRR